MRILPTSLRDRLRTGLLTASPSPGWSPWSCSASCSRETLSAEIRQRSLADARQSAQLIDTVADPAEAVRAASSTA